MAPSSFLNNCFIDKCYFRPKLERPLYNEGQWMKQHRCLKCWEYMLHECSNQSMVIIPPLWGPRDIFGKGVEKMYKSENRGESLEHCLWVQNRQSSQQLWLPAMGLIQSHLYRGEWPRRHDRHLINCFLPIDSRMEAVIVLYSCVPLKSPLCCKG